MKYIKKLLIICLILPTFLVAQSSSMKEKEIKEVSKIHDYYLFNKEKGGGGILIVEKGKIIHLKGYGEKNGKTVTPKTNMSIASVTKQFAAMCVMMLIEEDKISLNDKASDYLDGIDLPYKNRAITIDDLLRHKSGLVNFIHSKQRKSYRAFLSTKGVKRYTNENHAEWIATTNLEKAPGVMFKYTNSGYNLLTRIVEVVSGKPFHKFQQERIFDVLGMKNAKDSKRFNGSGNMIVSMEDYARWDLALWTKDTRLISKKGYETIFSRGKLDNGRPVDYGFGWIVDYKGAKLVGASHGGWGSGKAAAAIYILRDFEREITIAIFRQEDKDWNSSNEHKVQYKTALAHEIHDYLINKQK